MMNAYFDYLREKGEKAVFGQMVTFQSRRCAKVLERYGFRSLKSARSQSGATSIPNPST